MLDRYNIDFLFVLSTFYRCIFNFHLKKRYAAIRKMTKITIKAMISSSMLDSVMSNSSNVVVGDLK